MKKRYTEEQVIRFLKEAAASLVLVATLFGEEVNASTKATTTERGDFRRFVRFWQILPVNYSICRHNAEAQLQPAQPRAAEGTQSAAALWAVNCRVPLCSHRPPDPQGEHANYTNPNDNNDCSHSTADWPLSSRHGLLPGGFHDFRGN